MVSPALTDAERYRNRAEEVRQIARSMRDKTAQEMLLRVAADYERMAEQLSTLDRNSPKPR